MPYSPTTWADTPATSSPISAANLNKIETELARLKVNADLDPAAAIAYSKLALALSIVNGDVSASAAIAYSKLNLASSIVNADVAAAAAIAASKLAAYPSDGTKFLAGDGTWKAAAATTYRKTTAKIVNTTVAATDLLNAEITVAAGVMGSTGMLRLTAFGDWKQNSGGATDIPRLSLKLGVTTLFDANVTGTAVVAGNAGRFGWRAVFEIMNLGAPNSQWATMDAWWTYANSGSFGTAFFATGEGITGTSLSSTVLADTAHSHGGNSGAVDTTASQALVLNVVNPSANALVETKLLGALVEVI